MTRTSVYISRYLLGFGYDLSVAHYCPDTLGAGGALFSSVKMPEEELMKETSQEKQLILPGRRDLSPFLLQPPSR